MNENKILLINSDRIEIAEIEAYLRESEYDITPIIDIPYSVENLNLSQYNLVMIPLDSITDEFMSVTTAVEVPVICIADKNITENNVTELYSLGCADYVTLPICKPALLARVKNQIKVVTTEKSVDEANDYLYNFCMPIFQDFKNNCNNTMQIIDRVYTEFKQNLPKKILSLLDAIKSHEQHCVEVVKEHYLHAQNESQHRGGFVRSII